MKKNYDDVINVSPDESCLGVRVAVGRPAYIQRKDWTQVDRSATEGFRTAHPI